MANNVFPVPMRTTSDNLDQVIDDGRLKVSTDVPRTAFRDLAVTQSTPIHSGSAQYGILNEVVPLASTGGSATAGHSLFKCESGVLAGGFGAISLDGRLAFRPGQGEKDLFSARFSLGQVGSEQFAGAINANSGGGWGYNGDEFGILVRFGGAIEIQTLTITSAAGGSENATITIDGTPYTVPLTSGTTQDNATEIADSLTAQVPLWFFEQIDNQVVATSLISMVFVGAFSFTSSTAVASFAQVAPGVLPIDSWTQQADWNGDTFPDLIPSNINNYKIQFGPGAAIFSIFSATGEYLIAHTVNTNNTSETLLIENPTFGHSWYALNRTGTTNVVVEGGFAGLYREGKNTVKGSIESIQAGKSAGTTMVPLFSIKVRGSINSVLNEATAVIRGVQVASDSSKPIIATLIFDGDLTGENWQYIDEASSILLIDRDATAVTGGKQLSITGFNLINNPGLVSELRRADSFTLAVNVTTGGASDFSGVITYIEDL